MATWSGAAAVVPAENRPDLRYVLPIAASSQRCCIDPAGMPQRGGRSQLGAPKTITAMAHKLVCVLWHLLKYNQAFDWNVSAKEAS